MCCSGLLKHDCALQVFYLQVKAMAVAKIQVVSARLEPHTQSTLQLVAEKAMRNFGDNLIHDHRLSLGEKRAAHELSWVR